MALKFHFRLVPFIAAVIMSCIGIALGQWQTGRAQEKEAIEARLMEREQQAPRSLSDLSPSIEDLEFQNVVLRGTFVPNWNIFLDNRPHGGQAGFHVASPFRLEHDGTYVLILRGWTPRDVADRMRVPAAPAPDSVVEIEGRIRRGASKIMQLGEPEPLRPGVIRQNIDIAELLQVTDSTWQEFVVEQMSDTGDGLVRDWPRPSSGADKHRGYAFQWYGLAFAVLVFFFVTGLKRESRDGRD